MNKYTFSDTIGNTFRVSIRYIGGNTCEYEFYSNDKLIFSNDDFHPSPTHQPESREAAIDLMGFLAVGVDAVEPEYFERQAYTPGQISWRDSREREALSLLVNDIENPQWELTYCDTCLPCFYRGSWEKVLAIPVYQEMTQEDLVRDIISEYNCCIGDDMFPDCDIETVAKAIFLNYEPNAPIETVQDIPWAHFEDSDESPNIYLQFVETGN